MANTVTYFVALDTAIKFLEDNEFDNKEVIDKLVALRKQKATKSVEGKKSAAREKNEELAAEVVRAMRDTEVDEIRAAWVRDNIEGINTVPKAVAVSWLDAKRVMGFSSKIPYIKLITLG